MSAHREVPMSLDSTRVPYADSFYVDGAGQLCITTCTTPMPENLKDIEPPF